jgi:hypothetical protein
MPFTRQGKEKKKGQRKIYQNDKSFAKLLSEFLFRFFAISMLLPP